MGVTMMARELILGSMTAALAVGLVVTAARGGPLFDIPGPMGAGSTLHFDLNGAKVGDRIPSAIGVNMPDMPNPAVGGPSGIFITGELVMYNDGLNAPPKPWQWETEIHNPDGESEVTFVAGWYWKQEGEKKAEAYEVTLPPGFSFYHRITFFDSPETGQHVWGCRNLMVHQFDVDASIFEGDFGTMVPGPCQWKGPGGGGADEPGGGVNWQLTDLPPNLKFGDIIPEPAPLVLLGFGAVAVLRRRRRR